MECSLHAHHPRRRPMRRHRLDGVGDSRADLISTLNEAAAASSDARDVMMRVEQTLHSEAIQLSRGADILETLCTPLIQELRSELNAAMEQVSSTRHQFRLAVVAQCVDQGMSARQISDLWGFSRQRAQALIQEARTPDSCSQGPSTNRSLEQFALDGDVSPN